MKIIILIALVALTFSIRVNKKALDNGNKENVEEASRTEATSQWVYLYNYSYTPVLSYSPVYYGAVSRPYYYYPYYSSYYYYPRSYFWSYRKDSNEETTPAEPKKAEAPAEANRVEKKEDNKKANDKETKIQVKIEELITNLKKLKKDLWKDENYDTTQLRKENKAYDPEWLLTQLNISTVLQIEDLLKENKIDSAKFLK
jgi:hypothetical protein